LKNTSVRIQSVGDTLREASYRPATDCSLWQPEG